MAGRGPAPMDPAKRARKSKARGPEMTVIHAEPSGQPELPEFQAQVKVDGELVWQEFEWPEQTRRWWAMWADSPLSADFAETDWDFLLDTALIHARYWMGTMSLAGELRLRVAKFGATPEDRARLRIQFAGADESEDRVHRRKGTSSVSRDRLRGVGRA